MELGLPVSGLASLVNISLEGSAVVAPFWADAHLPDQKFAKKKEKKKKRKKK